MPFFSVLFFSLCAIGSLVQPSRGLSVTNVFTPLPDVAERPTPIILLPGEGLGPDVFHLWVESLQSKGYGGVVTTLASTDDPEALGSAIHDIVESEHMVPPVLVAHSIGSYAAINYLESHSLAGLVLLNPIPVHPSQAASMLSSKHADCVATSYQTETEDSEEGIMSRYYGLRPPNVIPSHFFAPEGFPTSLVRNLSRHADVKLEPGVVPCLVILSGGDNALYDYHQEKDMLDLWQVRAKRPVSADPMEADSAGIFSISEESVFSFDGPEGMYEDTPHLLRLPYDMSRYGPGNHAARERAIRWIETYT